MVRKMNPLYLILAWLVLAAVFTIICMIFLGISVPGGGQRPFTFLGKAIPIIVYGVLVIAIVSTPFYFEWIKKYWYVNLFFITACIMFAYKDWRETNKNSYYTDIKTITINGRDYEQTTQYYDSKSTKIRSMSYYLNGKKDSTWTVYAEDGSIINQKKYKNGELAR